MFSRHKDASKIALAHLCVLLQEKGFGIIDCQMETSHLASLGARPIPRSEFAARLETLVPQAQDLGPWSAESVSDYYRARG
jgi:leucyl/phenylalanyl-tRNA--protein transferase